MTHTRRYDAVLFDLGGVITVSPFIRLHAVADRLGMSRTELIDFFLGPDGIDTDHPWHQVERGEITYDEMRAGMRKLAEDKGLNFPFERRETANEDNPLLHLRPDVLELISELGQANYKLALVTNNAAQFRPLWRRSAPWDDLFDIVIDSHEVGMRKPDPRIYRLALERLGHIDPARAIFVDDMPGNIAGAQAVGLTGILVDVDHEPFVAEVRRLTGLTVPTA